MTANGRGCTWTPIDPNASIEEKLAAIEKNLNHIHERINHTENSLEQKTDSLAETINSERSLRAREIEETHKKIESASTGGLHISATGALWLLIGVTMSTAPSEIFRLMS